MSPEHSRDTHMVLEVETDSMRVAAENLPTTISQVTQNNPPLTKQALSTAEQQNSSMQSNLAKKAHDTSWFRLI